MSNRCDIWFGVIAQERTRRFTTAKKKKKIKGFGFQQPDDDGTGMAFNNTSSAFETKTICSIKWKEDFSEVGEDCLSRPQSVRNAEWRDNDIMVESMLVIDVKRQIYKKSNLL